MVVAIVLMSWVISMTRGVIKEVTSLFTWIIAFLAARLFAERVADIAFSSLEPRALAVMLGFVSVYVLCLFAQSLLRSFLTSAVKAMGLGGVNRFLGGVFGVIKALFLITLGVLIASFTDLPNTNTWQESLSIPFFEHLASLAVPYLPDYLANKLMNQ
ncbi:MAG: CvpA family protein [Neisseria sp.]|nr:CvpA family protein [Neisseria sp.]